MLYYNTFFKDSKEFKELFSVHLRENGEKSRGNAFLLRQLKHKPYLRLMDQESKSYMQEKLCSARSDAELFDVIGELFSKITGFKNIRIPKIGFFAYSKTMSTDYLEGICLDGDETAVRYVNMEKGKVFKMRAGKFYRRILSEQDLFPYICPQVVNYLCEEFAAKFRAYSSDTSNYTLVCDDTEDDFMRIYTEDHAEGDLGSCMTNEDAWQFYRDAVKAKAAYLLNKEGLIVARCIIFTEVEDEDTGETLRLAERQYSSGNNLALKRILISRLIDAGEIDGYKKVGAGCRDIKAFVANDETDWSHRRLRISCDLNIGDTLSFQDTFIYYDMDQRRACNSPGEHTDLLNSTDGRLLNYDEWHDEGTEADLVTVYHEGCAYTCAEDRLDGFVWVDDLEEYHHDDDVCRCDNCKKPHLREDIVYSKVTGEYYCCEDCRDEAEQDYKEENPDEDADIEEATTTSAGSRRPRVSRRLEL